MGLQPPPRWDLYRNHAKIGASTYRIPIGWCVLVSHPTIKVIGPRQDDSLSLDTAIESGFLMPIFEASESTPVGRVQSGWFWHDKKGLLTEQEIANGETGAGEYRI